MYGPEGNSYFCFPESPDVSLDEVKHQDSRANKLSSFPKDNTLSALLYIFKQSHSKSTKTFKDTTTSSFAIKLT